MDIQTRTNLVAAAVTATGPASNYFTEIVNADGDTVQVPDRAAWQAAVQDNALAIAVMSSDDGPIGKALDQIEKCKVFTGTVAAVKKEERSTRAFITLHTGTERESKGPGGVPLPTGYEGIRTERTDNPVGRAMARKMVGLVGHRVAVWVENEPLANGQGNVRVLRYVEDLGVDKEAAAKVLTTVPA